MTGEPRFNQYNNVLNQSPDRDNPKESAGIECKPDALKYSASYAAYQNPPISPKGSKLAPDWSRNGREVDLPACISCLL